MSRPVIFSNHIPKTGGTSLAHALRSALGADAFFPLGPHSRFQRFCAGLPQFEELSVAERAPIRVVHGHGVRLASLLWLPEAAPDFIVILRAPRSHARSRYFHRLQSKARRADSGDRINLDANPMASYLVKHYPFFAEHGAEVSVRNALSVLKRFKYVLRTESLAPDFALLAGDYGLSAEIGHKRPGGYKPADADSVPFDPQRYAVDLALYEAVSNGAGAGIRNPVGFDQAALDRSIKALNRKGDAVRARYLDRTENRLAAFAVGNLEYQVALERIRRGDHGLIGDADAFAKRMRTRYARRPYDDRKMARAKIKLADYLDARGETARARAERAEARRLDPSVVRSPLRVLAAKARRLLPR